MKDKKNILGIISFILTIVSLFLPWIVLNATSSDLGPSDGKSFDSFGLGKSDDPYYLLGVFLIPCLIGVVIALLSAFMMFLKSRFTIAGGIVNILIGVGCLLGILIPSRYHDSIDVGTFWNIKTSFNVSYGIYLFLGSSVLFAFASMKYFNKPNTDFKAAKSSLDSVNLEPVQSISEQIVMSVPLVDTQTCSICKNEYSLNEKSCPICCNQKEIESANPLKTQKLNQSVSSSSQQETLEVIQHKSQTCLNCNTQYVLGTKFCPECGMQATKETFCDECGTKLRTNVRFCPKCGKEALSLIITKHELDTISLPPKVKIDDTVSTGEPKTIRSKKKLPLIIGILALITISVIIVFLNINDKTAQTPINLGSNIDGNLDGKIEVEKQENKKLENSQIVNINISEDQDCNKVVVNWNEAHNTKDLELFASIFAENVNYYHTPLTKGVLIQKKRELMLKYPNFNQQIIGQIVKEHLKENEIKCSFEKRVTINQKDTNYPSYLILTISDNKWKISEESDLVTDRNVAKKKAL